MVLKIKICILFIVFVNIISCSNDRIDTVANLSTIEKDTDVDLLKNKFSFALAKVLFENENVRELIKTEALKQFDYDYDVLYMLVKGKILKDGNSLETLLSQYMDKRELLLLVHQVPTLTIFVPMLPYSIFSVETWNVDKEIPCVAYKSEKGQYFLINYKGEVSQLNKNEIPSFPIVVVKPSERVLLQSKFTRNQDYVLYGEDGMNFVFEFPEFNNISKSITRVSSTDIPDNLKKIFDAKKFADQNGIWQRDYIYYNIINSTGRGAIQRNISECIYSFELSGDPKVMFNILSDQDDDPKHLEEGPNKSSRPDNSNFRDIASYWYNGNYEFVIKMYIGHTNLIVNEITKPLSISPYDLFDLDLVDRGRSQPLLVKGVKSFKKYYLPEPKILFDWDIENCATTIKISIDEQDSKKTTQSIVETTTSFATNFEFDLGSGEKKKIGAKFGASSTIQQKVSTTVTTYLDSDPLGDVIVNFGDDVVVKNKMDSVGYVYAGDPRNKKKIPIYKPVLNPKYNSGYYKIEILPLAVY